MGSFIGHMLPGSLFFLIGLWHIWSSIVSFVSKPRLFRSRVWHPCRLPGPLRYLELVLLVLGSFLDMVPVELLAGTSFRPIVDGGIAPGHLNNFEHASMLLLFFLFGLTVLISETTSLLPLPEGALHVVAAAAFSGEFVLFFFHSTNHTGLEARYHTLLSLEIALCMLLACLCAAYPHSFLLDLMGAVAVTLQGLWFFQTAFSLYGSLLPTGCHVKPEGVFCDPKYEMRATGMATLLFTAHIAALIVLVLALYALAVRIWGSAELWDLVAAGDYQVIERERGEGGSDLPYELKVMAMEEEDVPVPLSMHGAHKPNGIFGSR